MRRYLLLLLLAFLPGTVSAQNWGHFSGPLLVQLLDDGRNVLLLADFSYTDPSGEVWLAPKGLVTDGASIPQAFWSFIGGPFEDRYRNAAVIHDEGCDTRSRTWQDTDLTFYDAMRCGGVGEAKAKIMYYAVYYFGPHWGPGSVELPQKPSGTKNMSTMSMTADTLHESSLAEGQAAAADIAAWITAENPSIARIQQTPPSQVPTAKTTAPPIETWQLQQFDNRNIAPMTQAEAEKE